MKSFFISSTFKDMQAERDILYQEVFPKMRKKLEKYGEDIQELDLRWGIDTSLTSEEENGRYIIESCIDAIDHCRPYMIVLIGDRYGWIPDVSDVRKTNNDRVMKLYQDEISITHMEIAYGVLENKQFERCIFCFRNDTFINSLPEENRALFSAESETHQRKLDELKEKIRSSENAIILDYTVTWDSEEKKLTGLSEFSKQLTEKLWLMVSGELDDKNISEEEKILNDARFSAERYMNSYIPRMDMSGSSALLGRSAAWFYGEPGCGKSAYLASVFEAAESVENHVFLYYCGNEGCSNLDTFLNTLLFWLRKENHKEAINLKDLSRTQKLAGIYDLLKTERVCDRALLIDGIDQMEEDIVDILIEIQKIIIREKQERFTYGLVMTSTEEFYDKNERKIRLYDFMTKKIGELQETELVAFSQMHAKRRGKQLDAKVQQVIRAKKNAGNPYYLSVILQQLFMMDAKDFAEAEKIAPGMEGLSLFMEKKVKEAPESVKDMIGYMLEHAAEKMNRGTNVDVMKIFHLLAVSQQGFTLKDIYTLLEMKGNPVIPAQMQRLFSYLYDSLYENKNGRWDFTHRLIRKNLLDAMSQDEFREWNLVICQYMQDNMRYAESFYYALCACDKFYIEKCIDAAMSSNEGKRKDYFAQYHRYLLKHQDNPDMVSVVSSDKYAWFAAHIVLEKPDQAMENHLYWKELISKLQKEEHLSEMTRFYLLCAEFALKKYEFHEERLLEVWDRISEQFFKLKIAGIAEKKAYYVTILWLISQKRFQKDYEKIITRLECLPFGARDLAKIMKMKKEKASQEEMLAEIEKFSLLMKLPTWQESDELEMNLHYVVNALYSQAAFQFLSRKKYQQAIDIFKMILPKVTERILFFPSIDERIQYAEIWYGVQQGVTADYKLKHIETFRNQYNILAGNYPLPYFEEGLAYSYLLEARAEEKGEETGKVDIDRPRRILLAYREATNRYEALVGTDRENPDNYYYLDMICYIRYRKLKRRLNNDIWTWKEEREIAITKNAPYFEEKMETDLRDMIEDTLILYKQKKESHRLQELLASYVDGVRYYDYHQEPEKAFTWCQKLLEWERKVNINPAEQEQLTRKYIFYYVADCYIRYGKYEEAKELMPMLFESMEKMYQKWLKPQDWASAYLLLMKCSVDESVEKQEEYYNLAWEKVKDLEDEKINPLKSDLKQTLAEAYYRVGNKERAVVLLELSSWLWDSLGTLYFSYDEEKNQKIFRYLCGQAMLARLNKDKRLLVRVIRKYKYILENYTTDKDIKYRPLLVEETQKIKDFFETEYPEEEIPEELRFLLLGNEEARKAIKAKSLTLQESQKIEELEEYINEGGDLTKAVYGKLIEDILKLQGKIMENVDKRSKEYEELSERNIRTVEKSLIYLWSNQKYTEALRCEYFITSQFEHRKKLAERMYSAKVCWEHWCELKEKRNTMKYISRMVEVFWANITSWAQEVCYRYFRETKDISWLYQAAQEAKDYRVYMMKRMNDNPADKDWNLEAMNDFYSAEQEAYLKMQESGLAEEKKWFEPFKESLNKQLSMNVRVFESFYTNKLKLLYQLQELNLEGQAEIHKMINKVVEKQGATDFKFQYYIHKAVRELGSDATTEDVQKFIEKQKEKDKGVHREVESEGSWT